MTNHRPSRKFPLAGPLTGAVATAAIPAIILSAAAPAPAHADAPAPRAFLTPKAPTDANISVAQTRIASHLVASRIPSHVAPAESASVVVRSGETLSGIAVRSGISVSRLVKINGLKSADVIRAGQRLKLSGPASSASSAPSSRSYTVVSGDTLSGIAERHGLGLSKLLKANGLSSASIIRPGQKLSVGSAAKSASSSRQLVPSTFLHYTYPKATVSSANANKATLLARNLPGRAQMRQIIAATARSMGVDPTLALAHAYQESGFNMTAVSPANAIGAMQVIPSSGDWASQLVGRNLDLLDPYDNATAGVAIIRALQRTSSTQEIGIASYYQGQGSVGRNGMFPDTKDYVRSVLALKKSFG